MLFTDQSYIAVLLGILIPSLVNINNQQGYSQVDHGLDEEELVFKRSIEMKLTNQSSSPDDIDTLFSEDMSDIDNDDLKFDSKELDRLSMLEKYRNNLVASVNLSSTNDNVTNDNSKADEELRI
eukprot:gene20938-27139_t